MGMYGDSKKKSGCGHVGGSSCTGGASDSAAAKEKEKNATDAEGFIGSRAGGGRRKTHRRKTHRRKTHRRKTHRRKTSHRRSKRRGGMGNMRKTLSKAVLPFGLLGLQRLMGQKKNRKRINRVTKRIRKRL